jgi:hypothetical protein
MLCMSKHIIVRNVMKREKVNSVCRFGLVRPFDLQMGGPGPFTFIPDWKKTGLNRKRPLFAVFCGLNRFKTGLF